MTSWNIKSKVLALVLFLGDATSLLLAWGIAMRGEHLYPFVFLILIWSLSLYVAGYYSAYVIGYRLTLAQDLFKIHLINSGLAILFFYFAPSFYITPKISLFIFVILSYFFIFGWRVLSVSVLKNTLGRGALYFIGPVLELKELFYAFTHNSYYSNFEVLGYKSLEEVEGGAEVDLEMLTRRAEKGIFSALAASLPHQHNDELIRKFYGAIFRGVQFFDFQKFYESVFHKIPVSLVSESWFLGNLASASLAVYDILKRVADVLVALVFGVLSLPLYPVVIFAIYLDDGFPIFYIPRRIGKGRRVFNLLKFRTMRVDADARWPEKNDPRITRVGKFLRRTTLDELPQLWNVLKGDISIVGPRPDLVNFAEILRKEIPYYDVRTLVKPGMTGWAQVSQKVAGENPSSVEETRERLAYDIYYIKNRSFLLDLAIILKTARLLLSRLGF